LVGNIKLKFYNSKLSGSLFKAFLIAYKDCFREVDNMDFFGNWRETQKEIERYDWYRLYG
jgi:hypothetical protein